MTWYQVLYNCMDAIFDWFSEVWTALVSQPVFVSFFGLFLAGIAIDVIFHVATGLDKRQNNVIAFNQREARRASRRKGG